MTKPTSSKAEFLRRFHIALLATFEPGQRVECPALPPPDERMEREILLARAALRESGLYRLAAKKTDEADAE